MALTSVFDIPGIEEPSDDEIDYKQLYEQERNLRKYYEKHAKALEERLQRYSPMYNDNRATTHTYIKEVRSYKGTLPNSVKDVQLLSHKSIEPEDLENPSLVKGFAIFGSREQTILQSKSGELLEGNVVVASDKESQMVNHAARLAFPGKVKAIHLNGKQAEEKCLDIMNRSADKIKSFILSFEPMQYYKREQSQDPRLIDTVNGERRIYAICLTMEDFTILGRECELNKDKSKKFVTFKDIEIQKLQIVVTERIYCIFSYYPFFTFFEEVIRRALESVKVTRYIRYKQSGEKVRAVDSISHTENISQKMTEISRESNQMKIEYGNLLDFSISPTNRVFLEPNKASCQSLLAVDWAYPILSLFTLDDFLTVLTLLLLQQKIIFVCSDLSILTYTVFLFGKVLIRPLQYPYPLVSIMPDQEDYLNAPFPVIYGLPKTKKQFKEEKLTDRYQNHYVLLEPSGVQISSKVSKDQLMLQRSPKLRDYLLASFKKISKNTQKIRFPWQFFKEEKKQFSASNIKQIALEIIDQVHKYILECVIAKLPNFAQVSLLKTDLESSARTTEEVNERVMRQIKQKYGKTSKDPFFKALLETQLLSVHLLQY